VVPIRSEGAHHLVREKKKDDGVPGPQEQKRVRDSWLKRPQKPTAEGKSRSGKKKKQTISPQSLLPTKIAIYDGKEKPRSARGGKKKEVDTTSRKRLGALFP